MDLLLFFTLISFGYVCTLCFVLFIIIFLFVFAFLISFEYVCTLCFVLFIIIFLFVFAFCQKPAQYWLKMSQNEGNEKEKQHLGVGLLSSYYYASSSWYRGKQLSVIFLIVLLFAPEVRCGGTMDSNAEIPVRTTLSKIQKK